MEPEIPRVFFHLPYGKSKDKNFQAKYQTIQAPNKTTDVKEEIRQYGSKNRETQSISCRLVGLLPIGRDTFYIQSTGWLDKKKVAHDTLERVEESSNQVQEFDKTWRQTRESMGMGEHKKGVLANSQIPYLA